DIFPQIFVVWHSANLFYNHSQQEVSAVTVKEGCAWFEPERKRGYVFYLRTLKRFTVFVTAYPLQQFPGVYHGWNPRRVIQHVSQLNFLSVRKAFYVHRQRIIERQFSSFGKLQYRRGGDLFRYRGYPELLFRCIGNFSLNVGHAVTGRMEYNVAPGNQNRPPKAFEISDSLNDLIQGVGRDY